MDYVSMDYESMVSVPRTPDLPTERRRRRLEDDGLRHALNVCREGLRVSRRAARVGPEARRRLGGLGVDAVLQDFYCVVDVAAPVVRHGPARPEDRQVAQELAPEAVAAAMDPRVDAHGGVCVRNMMVRRGHRHRADGVVLTLEVTHVILRGGGCEERHEPEASTHYSILAVLRRCMCVGLRRRDGRRFVSAKC